MQFIGKPLTIKFLWALILVSQISISSANFEKVCERYLSEKSVATLEERANWRQRIVRAYKNISLKARVHYLMKIPEMKFLGYDSNKRLAGLINALLAEKLISIDDAQRLIMRLERKEIWQFFREIGPDGEIRFNIRLMDAEDKAKAVRVILGKASGLQLEQAELYRNFLNGPMMSYKDLIHLNLYVKNLPVKPAQVKTFLKYLEYCDSLIARDKRIAIEQAAKLFNGADTAPKYVLKFRKLMRSFELYENRQLVKLVNQNRQSALALNNEEYIRIARDKRKVFEYYTMRCNARGRTAERIWASSRFKKFSVWVSLGSNIGSYTYTNWHKEKDARWFKTIGFDVVISLVLKLMAVKIQLASSDSTIMKMYKDVRLGFRSDIPTSWLYDFVLGSATPKEIMKRINELKESDKGARAELEELEKYITNNEDVQQFMAKIIAAETEDDLWAAFGAADENHPMIDETLMGAIANKIYDESEGLIKTGNAGVDRYLYHRIYSLYGAARGIGAGLWTYKILCMGRLSPATAIAKAFSIFLVDKVFSSYVYYYGRKYLIDQ